MQVKDSELSNRFSARIKTGWSDIRKAYSVLWNHGKVLIFLMALGMIMNPLFSVASTVLPAAFLGNLSAGSFDSMSLETFFSVCSPAILYILLDSIVFSVYFAVVQRAEKRSFSKLKLRGHRDSSEILGQIDSSRFDDPETYDIIKNGYLYDYNIAKNTVRRPFDFIGNVITYISYIYILRELEWYIILILAVSIVITYLITAKVDAYKDKIFVESTPEKRRYSFLLDLLLSKSNLQELRIYGLFTYLQNKLSKSHEIISEFSVREFKHSSSFSILSYIISAFPAWVYYAYIMFRTYSGHFTLGQFFLLCAAVENFIAYTQNFASMLSQMNREALTLEHHREFRGIKSEIIDDTREKIDTGIRNIECRNVCLDYNSGDDRVKRALSDVSFTVPAGSLVSIVGPNGAGKSSLVKVLTRLYDPSDGSVLINGRDLKKYDGNEWYRLQGVLPQNYHLFALSVEENIAFSGNDGERIRDAARFSECDRFIEALPEQYETVCGKSFRETGVDFSGGESQRICLARAFYKNSDIWILDEPSAAIDPIAEDSIFEYLLSQKGKKTIFVVSHRLSVAKNSDLILVLDGGHLVEAGDHSGLMDKDGLYAKMFRTQAERYI